MGIRTYGTSIDKKTAKESAEAREIVGEIINFGVSQDQILYIINDLAMNIENPDHMRRILNVVKSVREDRIVITTKSPLEV